MSEHPRAGIRLILGLAVMVGLIFPGALVGGLAWGQDDWDAAAKEAQPPAANMLGGARIALPDFEQWVCGGKTQQQIQRGLESLLALHVDSVAQTCKLSDGQRRKLELAGQGDMTRLSESVEQLREKFLEVGQDQERFNKIASEVGPLQMKLQTGDFGETSLYLKVLKRTLDPEQSAQYAQQEQERRKFRYEAKIELAVSMLENTMPLRAEQHQQFLKLLADETKPPKKFGQQDYFVVFYQAGKLGEEKLKPIFDEAQWQAVKKTLDQARSMERFLKSNGFLP